MNWFTTKIVANVQEEERIIIARELEDACDHVTEYPAILYVISKENDSFGVVGEYGMCEQCYLEMKAESDNEIVTCHDCNRPFPKKETISWTWYDFYAAQGDIPMIICKDCKNKPRHIERVKQDQEDSDEEMYGPRF